MLMETGVHFSMDNLIWIPRNLLASLTSTLSSLLHILVSVCVRFPCRNICPPLKARLQSKETWFVRTYEPESNQNQVLSCEVSHRNKTYVNYFCVITTSCPLTWLATQLAQTLHFAFRSADGFQTVSSSAATCSKRSPTMWNLNFWKHISVVRVARSWMTNCSLLARKSAGSSPLRLRTPGLQEHREN